MPAGATYNSIQKITLNATAYSSVSFTNIPQTYTDLILVANPINTGTTAVNIYFNNDFTATYSCTRMYGEGANAYSDRFTNTTQSLGGWGTNANTNPYLMMINIMNYTNTTNYKNALTNVTEMNAGYVGQVITLWRVTSAITTVTFQGNANFGTGSTFNLYGVASA